MNDSNKIEGDSNLQGEYYNQVSKTQKSQPSFAIKAIQDQYEQNHVRPESASKGRTRHLAMHSHRVHNHTSSQGNLSRMSGKMSGKIPRSQYFHRDKKSKEEKSQLNFRKWLLTMVSIGNLVLSPLIVYMGYQASQYDYNDLLIVDKALMALGAFVFFISLANIFTVAKGSDELMILTFYSCLITFILLTIFAIGAISFSENLLDFVDKHWDEIRESAKSYTLNEFKGHVSSELVSLGAFALTIDLSLFIMMSTIIFIQGLEKIMVALFPLTNLLFIVFSTAVIVVAIYSNQHTYYTSALPVWANYITFLIGIFILIIAIFGYYSVTHGRYAFLLIYIIVLILSSLVCLATGLGMIIKTSNIKEAVSREWPEIQNRLQDAGYDINESTFANFLEVNVKFAGLFVIIFCLFLIIGLIPAVYLSFTMKRRKMIGKGQSVAAYRLNSEQERVTPLLAVSDRYKEKLTGDRIASKVDQCGQLAIKIHGQNQQMEKKVQKSCDKLIEFLEYANTQTELAEEKVIEKIKKEKRKVFENPYDTAYLLNTFDQVESLRKFQEAQLFTSEYQLPPTKEGFQVLSRVYAMKQNIVHNRKKHYQNQLTQHYLDIHRCMNTLVYNTDQEQDKFLNEDFFSRLRKFHELSLLIKYEEKDTLSKSQFDDECLANYLKKFEEQLARLLSNNALSHSRSDLVRKVGKENLEYFETRLSEWKTSQTVSLLQQICSQKYFYNIANSKSSIQLADSILPISAKESYDEYDFDIVFIPGQYSHPLRSWTINEEEDRKIFYKIWIKEFLLQDLKEEFPEYNPRVLCLGYDSHTNVLDLLRLNIEDRHPKEIADTLLRDLKGAQVGKKPVIIVSFSMGGILLKMMLQKDQELKDQTSSVLFIGTPHKGSEFMVELEKQLRYIFLFWHTLMDLNLHAIPMEEYNQKLMKYVGLSKTSKYLCRPNGEEFDHMHKEFLKSGIPFHCLAEGRKIDTSGLRFQIVTPQSALVEGAQTQILIKDKNHYQLQKVMRDKQDITYQVAKNFILNSVKDLKTNMKI